MFYHNHDNDNIMANNRTATNNIICTGARGVSRSSEVRAVVANIVRTQWRDLHFSSAPLGVNQQAVLQSTAVTAPQAQYQTRPDER